MPALTVKSAVRKAAKGFRISPQFFAALDKAVAELVVKATKRAKANGRKTLRPEDL